MDAIFNLTPKKAFFFKKKNILLHSLTLKCRFSHKNQFLRQLQVETLANVIFANFSVAILKNRQNGRSIPGHQMLTS